MKWQAASLLLVLNCDSSLAFSPVRQYATTSRIDGLSIYRSGSKTHASPDPYAGLINNIVTPRQELTQAAKSTSKAFVSKQGDSLVPNTSTVGTNGLEDAVSSITSSVYQLLEDVINSVKSLIEAKTGNTALFDLSILQNTFMQSLVALKERIIYMSAIIGNDFSTLSPPVEVLGSAVITYTILSFVFNVGKGPPPSKPYPMGRYDPGAARAYFDARIGEVLARALEIGLNSAKFGLALANDYLRNELDKNAAIRAQELSSLLTRLGPTFIKVGQSLSIRTDLLSKEYVVGLKSLQDQVPAFPSDIAREIIEEELGQNVDEIFEDFSEEPVAAASLGQVYKARLRSDGREVALKVQRPDIMKQIALDMHLLRELAPIVKRTFNLNSDTVGTVDAWGAGFVDELDYIAEAENAEYFTESIQATPLAGVVFAPPIVDDLTTGRVLTTEWVDGQRLDKSTNDDVTILCSIAMNTYLTMMLETGVLHCDPHPGNLLRTPDGKLCILDWGMVTRLDPDLQITLIEHMAHLTSRDYAEIPRDLLLLGFIPESKADLIEDSGIVEVLASIYSSWTDGRCKECGC